jgi:DNA-directed RNA polymerase specialized sigma subunit
MAFYVKNKELKRALHESKTKGSLTEETVKMFMLIVEGMSRTKSYRDIEDKEDCMSAGLEDLIKYWNRYSPEKSDNAFAFITQIAHNGMKKGWKKIHPPRSPKTIPFSRIVKEGNSSYNV